jgi:hypothetical protein
MLTNKGGTHMKIVKYANLDEEFLNHFANQDVDPWFVYNYLEKFKTESKKQDLFIPIWLYNYLRNTELKNDKTTLYKALESDFHVYGVKSDEFNEWILIIRFD